jgi:hypothetical protein
MALFPYGVMELSTTVTAITFCTWKTLLLPEFMTFVDIT